MLNKSLIQFSVDGLSCVPSLLFGLRPNYGRGNDNNGNLLQKDLCMHCCVQCPSRPLSTHATTGDSWTLTGKFSLAQSLVGTLLLLVPGAYEVLFMPSKSLFPQSYGSSVIKPHWPPKSDSLGVVSPFAGSPGWVICCVSFRRMY